MEWRRYLRVFWRRLKYSPHTPNRKQAITFGLVITPILLYWRIGDHWTIALLSVGVGVLLSTDYKVIDDHVSSRIYRWIQNTETLLDAVEQNYHAAKYAAEDHDPFELSYWEKGHFRATVPTDRNIKSGIRFLVQCEVTSQDEQISYWTPFCTAEVKSVSSPSNGFCEVKMDVVRWMNDYRSGNELDRVTYRDKTQKLYNGNSEISPIADIDESNEMGELKPEEWRTLLELLEKTELHEGR